jgi:hypothetical protein
MTEMNVLLLKRPPAPPGEVQVILSFKHFLVLDRCPPEWLGLNLYLFRDEKVAFYAGQSERAYERVWQHIQDAYKGRSVIGRFILCNWPISMHFTIELYSAAHERFSQVEHNLNAAEKQLIEQWQPCFNVISNPNPAPLPPEYQLPASRPQHLRRLGTMRSEARAYIRAEKKRQTLSEDRCDDP